MLESHTFSTSTWEAEGDRSLWVQNQSCWNSEFQLYAHYAIQGSIVRPSLNEQANKHRNSKQKTTKRQDTFFQQYITETMKTLFTEE